MGTHEETEVHREEEDEHPEQEHPRLRHDARDGGSSEVPAALEEGGHLVANVNAEPVVQVV